MFFLHYYNERNSRIIRRIGLVLVPYKFVSRMLTILSIYLKMPSFAEEMHTLLCRA
ncbi:hypothetical protein HMPREF1869_01816 [Bacteroidales bacterium KA00251]|nr:hypothetical protein HMPREF1869_01816 [Bacteroidales bacterium KA00251]